MGCSGTMVEEDPLGKVTRRAVRRHSRERDVHNHPRQKHIGGQVNSFNSYARGVLFLHVRILVTKEITEDTTVIYNVRIDQSRKVVRVDAITVWLVVLSVARVVYHECI
jgi:hypothetical protein